MGGAFFYMTERIVWRKSKWCAFKSTHSLQGAVTASDFKGSPCVSKGGRAGRWQLF
jgi:hypothetical protein